MTSTQDSTTGNPILSPSNWGSLVPAIYSRDEMKQEGLMSWSELSLEQQADVLGSKEAVSHISGPGHLIYGAVFNKDGHFYGVHKEFAKANIIPNKPEKRSYLVAGDGSSMSQKSFGIGPFFLRSEPSSSFVALFGSQDPEIKNNLYPITTPEGPLTVTNAETSEMEPVQLRQYGTGGYKNNFDATAHSDVNKFKYQAHTSSQHAVRGHKLVTLENGTQAMALTLITALVITSMQYLLTEANLLNPSKSNGGDDMRSRLKKLNKEKFKKLKKETEKAAYKEAENELFVECLKEDVANSFTVEDSDIFKSVVKFTQKRIKNEETGKYETDPTCNDKGGTIYLTMKKPIFTNVYENSTKKKVPFPSESITGIPTTTLELAYTGGKNFQHVPLVSGEDPSKELPCQVRDSLQPGAILNGVVQIKFVKTPTGSDARAKIQLERLQLLDQGDGPGGDSAQEKEQAMLLKPIRFGKPMLTAPPPVAASAPRATKRSEPSPTEEKEPRKSPKKRRKVLQDEEAEDGEGAPAVRQYAGLWTQVR